jgi:integrase
MHKGIYKDPRNNMWYISTRINTESGYHHVTIRGYESKNAASDDYSRAIGKWKIAHKLIQKNGEFQILINKYFVWREKKVRHTSVVTEQYLVDKYLASLKDLSIVDIASGHLISDWYQSVLKFDLSNKRKNLIIRQLKHILDFAFNNDFISTDDNRSLQNLLQTITSNTESTKEKAFWTMQERDLFLKTFEQPDSKHRNYEVFFKLRCHLGCRVGEIIAIQTKHFDEKNHGVHIVQQCITKNGKGQGWTIAKPKTNSSIRFVTISPDIEDLLKRYITNNGFKPDDFLFFYKRPVGQTTIRRILNKHIKLAHITPITIHGIRHSNTTWLLQNIKSISDVKAVSQRLGHNSTNQTLDTYFHLVNGSSQDLADLLSLKSKNQK